MSDPETPVESPRGFLGLGLLDGTLLRGELTRRRDLPERLDQLEQLVVALTARVAALEVQRAMPRRRARRIPATPKP